MKGQPELITLVMAVDRSGLDMFLFVYCKQDFLMIRYTDKCFMIR